MSTAAFSRVPARAASDGRLSRTALCVLIALCRYVDEDGVAFPSQSTLARDLGMRRRQSVNAAIRELMERGYLRAAPQRRRTGGGFSTLTYTVLYEAPSAFEIIRSMQSPARARRAKNNLHRVQCVADTVKEAETTAVSGTHRTPSCAGRGGHRRVQGVPDTRS